MLHRPTRPHRPTHNLQEYRAGSLLRDEDTDNDGDDDGDEDEGDLSRTTTADLYRGVQVA